MMNIFAKFSPKSFSFCISFFLEKMGLFFILRKIKCDLNDDDFISSFLIINLPKSVQYNKVFFPVMC